MNMKVIKICLKKYQIIIRKVKAEFASEIQKFEKFRKLIKKIAEHNNLYYFINKKLSIAFKRS